jgi:hypothetical protein
MGLKVLHLVVCTRKFFGKAAAVVLESPSKVSKNVGQGLF